MTTNPICLTDFEKIAAKKISENVWNYFSMGSDDQFTQAENCKAYNRLRIRPRFLQGVEKVNMKTKILGHEISMPICISPTALHKLACLEGEIATAIAAESAKVGMTISVFSAISWKDVAESAKNAILFANLYPYKDKKVCHALVRKAELAGCRAIVLTVDSPTHGNSLILKREGLVIPEDIRFENFETTGGSSDVDTDGKPGNMEYTRGRVTAEINRAQNWADIDWLRSITKLPIILKGILTREDALEALKHDVQGILVSNHGGRQLDGVPATIEALPEIVAAVDGKLEVYVDGGIRRGTDVFKALALGAKAVFIGRAVIWGLSYNGEDGVKEVLSILKDEFERTMILSGCKDISDITPDMVVHESCFCKLPTASL